MNQELKITFLGAAGTVTGSKYLLECAGRKVLVDAGMFQGERAWRERNWDRFPVDLGDIQAVLLTHAHIDHTGILPRLHAQGLNCPIYCTKPTAELSELLLPDSGRLQEEEAEYRRKPGKSRHQPVLPLYTEDDARSVLSLFRSKTQHEDHQILPGLTVRWQRMGHILGAASLQVAWAGRRITFSGDVGRYGVPILKDPEPVDFGDLLLIESTYGDRGHGPESPGVKLAEVIKRTHARGGVIVIPSFAVGRTQSLLFHLRELKESGSIPNLPVIIDSPMAADATEVYARNPDDYDEQSLHIIDQGRHPFTPQKMHYARSRAESIALNGIVEPMIIISASGMLSGGRILHHLKQRISSPLNTILFVGYQPQGGRGQWIQSGAKSMRLLGEEVPIRAEIAEISGLSAHGDQMELLRWCRESRGSPGRVAVVHGEPQVSAVFGNALRQEFGWNVGLPRYQETWSVGT